MSEQAGGGALFLFVAIGLAVLAAFALLEAWLLLNDKRPITGYVREAINAHAKIAAGVAFVVGLLGGHFFWQ
jgi:hypothetical protein